MGSSRAERSLAEKEPTTEGPSRWDPLQGDLGVLQKAEERRIGGEEKRVQKEEWSCPGCKCKALLCGWDYSFCKES